MKAIAKLDQSVINRIAAGEIIHHPSNAVKELLENSLDAGSQHIQITLIAGSLYLIQIKDDGNGIKMDDMPLVCERYATSKLIDFNDLRKLNTFGFRGEALASISHIAKVTITSKSKNSSFGYQAVYEDGKILSKPKVCASNYGTMISVQNLFANTPTRKKALRSPHDEFLRILDVVKKYAIHFSKIGFTLKKETNVEIPHQKATDTIVRIKQIYGTKIASNIKSTSYQDGKFFFNIFFTDINSQESAYRVDKKNNAFILFVNNRLVENTKLKKEVRQVYNNIKSGYKPAFVYLSLTVNPSHIDVNIHPTKNEVRLLNEEFIVEKVCGVLDKALIDASPSNNKKKTPPTPLPEKATLNHYFKPQSTQAILSHPPSSQARSTQPSSIQPLFAPPQITQAQPSQPQLVSQRAGSISSESISSTVITPPASPLQAKKGDVTDWFIRPDNGSTVEESDPSLSGPHASLTHQQLSLSASSRNVLASHTNRTPNYREPRPVSRQMTAKVAPYIPIKNLSQPLKSQNEASFGEDRVNPYRQIPPIDSQVFRPGSQIKQNQATSFGEIHSNPTTCHSPIEPQVFQPYSQQSQPKKKQATVYLPKVNNAKPVTAAPLRAAASIYNDEEEESVDELESILILKQEIKDGEDKALSKILARQQHVGCLGNVVSLSTYKDQYYLLNYNVVSEEYLYQALIFGIGKFGMIQFNPISIKACISLRMPSAPEQELYFACQSICAHKDLLKSYYSIDIKEKDGNVVVAGLPMVLRNYVPTMDQLPEFLFNLATEVEWDNEIECLDALAHELASFYSCTDEIQWRHVTQAITQGHFQIPTAITKECFIIQLKLPF